MPAHGSSGGPAVSAQVEWVLTYLHLDHFGHQNFFFAGLPALAPISFLKFADFPLGRLSIQPSLGFSTRFD